MFHFSYGNGTSGDTIGDLPDVTAIVSVTVGSNEGSHDLMSCLSAQFAPPGNEAQRKQNVILELSDIVAFELHPGYRGSAKDRKPFSYPKVIYLDQFMQENADFAQATRARQRAISEEVDKLTLRKKSLTSFDVSTLLYFGDIFTCRFIEQEHPERSSLDCVLLRAGCRCEGRCNTTGRY